MFFKILFFCIIIVNFAIFADEKRLIIASTTSVNDTGLLKYLNEEFNKEYNIVIHVLAVGTGQAIEIAKNGNADILLVHDTPYEKEFVKKGYGIERYDLMYNDFIIIGPIDSNYYCNSIEDVLLKIKNNNNIFLSRGDNSGTHNKEVSLWHEIKLNPKNFSTWYKKIGQGMGNTLIMANEMQAYTLIDRGTWIKFNKKEDLKIICQNKPPLFNQYGIIAVNPNKHKKINYEWANTYIKWIISEKGKKLINSFNISDQQLFFYNHQKK